MSEINHERFRLLVKICQLYYEDGLNQQDIAGRLGLSRPHVSRMLTTAKNEGIVKISINNPFSTEQELEKKIIEIFGIHDALIIDSGETDLNRLYAELGRTSAALIESMLRDRDIVGIMAGRTVASAAEELDFFAREGLQFVPLVGGWGPVGASWHASSNTMAFANKLKSNYWIMHAPAIVASEETGILLRQEPEIERVLQLGKQSRVAVVSIGEVNEEATMVQSGNFCSADMAFLEERGAVANLCASFLDRSGCEIDFPGKQRFIGLTARELRAVPNVIGIAGGARKVEAITAALRGKWIDILVTDAATARAIIAYHTSNESM
ncbi:DNA-binding transcriptional regulator [Paenibacillus baekrokdamisoli]|uniref:DNA-binding transcriptional regulator n=1 Tax=Paenibacillus baekrokdamisoli TaxID=1712516 RepID=A0A3G9IPD4_9BACL|nr:sugar-binding transcriptional regulator [Paenibacillus baekrokdamisoli]MBB3069927.1 DNA-binding transcriptional regulator LsrR (DeoR family) [Paenibacillus baekrokdamisoli]BBH20720.1 DNA-binding transcriptional regulator [Paenibacillus baekrokdamisoli]